MAKSHPKQGKRGGANALIAVKAITLTMLEKELFKKGGK